jgi:hypothetical protein
MTVGGTVVGVDEAVEDDVGHDRAGLTLEERFLGRCAHVVRNAGAVVDVRSSTAGPVNPRRTGSG